jgi:dTDP-4-dehydrorhamnose reductase
MLYVVKNQAAFGTYQLSNDDSCTWYEFAREILKDTDTKVLPVTSAQYPQKAKRPAHSIMSLDKAEATGFVVPTWEEALGKFLRSVD